MNCRPICFIFVALVALFLSGCTGSDVYEARPTFEVPAELQPGVEIRSETYGDVASAMDEYVESVVDKERFSGSILAARDGEIVLKKGYGLANIESGVLNSPETIFRLASVTKQFTAMAILQLQEAGNLEVQDPISRYLPDYPNGDEITIHQLLTHTSGIGEYTSGWCALLECEVPHTPDELIALFRDEAPIFPPGTNNIYNNSGYVLLGKIIEEASGQTYQDYVEEHIFSALDMSNSGYEDSEQGLPGGAIGYRWLRTPREARFVDMSIAYSAGALYSTVDDLYIWDQALRSEALLSKASLDSMFSPHAEIPVTDSHTGYGWVVITDALSPTAAWHNGQVNGFGSHIYRYLDDEAVIIILSNFQYAPVDDMAAALSRMLFP